MSTNRIKLEKYIMHNLNTENLIKYAKNCNIN